MNVIVCIKPVPSQIIINQNGEMIRDKVKNVINPLDKSALEEALRIKETDNGTVTAISMGTKSTTSILKEALALGIDKAILLNDNSFAGSDTNATSYILSCAINKINDYDLIICGSHSTDSATGQVGIELAVKLGLPFAINVIETRIINWQTIECKSETNNGYIVTQLKLPALITVNKDINIPRLASISNILESQKKEVEVLSGKDLNINLDLCGLKGSPTKVTNISHLVSEKNDYVEIKGTPSEKVKEIIKIVKNNLTDKTGNIYDSFGKIEQVNNDSDIFVYCKISNDTISQSSLALLAKSRELALKLKTNVAAVVINEKDNVINELFKHGADKVYYIKDNDIDYYASAVKINKLVKQYKPQIFLFGKSFNSKIISAFIASTLNTGLAADCVDLDIDSNNNLIQKRIVYGGTMVADIICPINIPQMATIYGQISNPIYNKDNTGSVIRCGNLSDCESKIKIIDMIKKTAPNIDEFNLIIGCGAGVQNKDILGKIEKIANKLNAYVGASRKAVDQGLLSYKNQVGLTGQNIKSKIYLACGISGSSEHMIGVNSNIIIAINKDKNAPIFKYANYGIIGDINDIIPLLIKEMEENEWN